MSITSWNVRGLNLPLIIKEVDYFLNKNRISIVGLLETKVREAKVQSVEKE